MTTKTPEYLERKRADAQRWRDTKTPSERRFWARKNNLKVNYKITVEQWEAQLESQGGVCPLCNTEIKYVEDVNNGTGQFVTNGCVDHDHNCCPGPITCGQCLRGILCRDCNSGRYFDNVGTLLKLVDYIITKGVWIK